jgi:hypothetical protein
MKAWEKEKADGVEQKLEGDEISGELVDNSKDNENKSDLEEEVPVEPIQVIRY